MKEAIVAEKEAKEEGIEIIQPKPKIQRRLGVGLAALIKMRKEDEQSEAGGSMTPA